MDLNVFFTGSVVLILVAALWGIMWKRIGDKVDFAVCKIVHHQLDLALTEINRHQRYQRLMMLQVLEKLNIDPPPKEEDQK